MDTPKEGPDQEPTTEAREMAILASIRERHAQATYGAFEYKQSGLVWQQGFEAHQDRGELLSLITRSRGGKDLGLPSGGSGLSGWQPIAPGDRRSREHPFRCHDHERRNTPSDLLGQHHYHKRKKDKGYYRKHRRAADPAVNPDRKTCLTDEDIDFLLAQGLPQHVCAMCGPQAQTEAPGQGQPPAPLSAQPGDTTVGKEAERLYVAVRSMKRMLLLNGGCHSIDAERGADEIMAEEYPAITALRSRATQQGEGTP